jgi:tetratricopeptide (TPR) repeat protein
MNAGQPQNPGTSNSSRIYFTIGICLLAMMALLWSLDASFVYIQLGAAVFFLFLGYWKRPRPAVGLYKTRQDTRRQVQGSSFSDLFKVQSKKRFTSQQSQNHRNLIRNQVLPYVIFFVASFLLMIVLPLLFSEDSMIPEDTSGFYQKAEQFKWSNQYDSADYYYRKALVENPENPEILNAYGVYLMGRTQYDQAMRLFDQVLQMDPDYQNSRYNKALVYYYRKSYRQSLDETFELMERNPSYYDAQVLAGDNYYAQQRYDSALYWYDAGYENGQRSVWLCHVMAYLYDQKGDQEKAVSLYQEALSYDSTRAEIYERLGELFPGQDGEQYRITAQQLKNAGY